MISDYKEDFRSQISTVDKKGHRNWIFPKKLVGSYYKWRTYVSYVLLVILFGLPLIQVKGHPFFMLNVFERKFIIFGQIFWPSDFYIFLVAILTFIVFVILFTVIFGRLWCGWACPQTIFMEMVFRKIEYWIDGDAIQQKRLAKKPWDSEKIFKRSGKYLIFFAISFFIANTLLAYIVGLDNLISIVTKPPSENIAGFTAVIGFSALFFWIYAFFREQVCTIICPYGRLQSVLLDKKSIVVSYDWDRGEKRYKNVKTRPEDAGDCIDCNQCVDVCPTGIDIRNGIQLECVSCAACIDACNFVMEKVNKPKGLIRHTSEENIETGKKFRITPRIIGYSALLTILMFVLGFMIVGRKDIKTNLTRATGSLYVETPQGDIRNIYQVKVSNKTFEELPVNFRLENRDGNLIINGNGETLKVPAEGIAETLLFVDIPKEDLKGHRTNVAIEVLTGGEVKEVVKANFLSPNN